jgi:hypothetical protein
MRAYLSILVALGLITGCASTATVDWVKIGADVAGLAAQTGATLDLKDHPDHAPDYLAVVLALDSLLQDPSYSAAKLSEALSKLPIKELSGDTGQLITGAAVTVFDLATGTFLDLSTQPAVAAVARSIREGLSAALRSAPIPAAEPRPTAIKAAAQKRLKI